jgi:hypothetical protein
MRSLIIVITAFLVSLTGCITMPEKVPDEYLSDKTSDQSKNLEKMENAVISKNHEVQTFKEKAEDAERKLKIEKGRLGILKDEKKLMEERQKQYQLENDSEKIGENAKLISQKESEIIWQVNRVEYAVAFRDHVKAQKEVVDTELSVLVAELNYERSRIAKDYLLKRQVNAAADKKDKASVDAGKYDEKYRAYLDKQREVLAAKRVSLEEAAVKLKITEDKLKR